MLDRVVSGGQTGADQGGLRAARVDGIPNGGWAPLGLLVESEDGQAWQVRLTLIRASNSAGIARMEFRVEGRRPSRPHEIHELSRY